ARGAVTPADIAGNRGRKDDSATRIAPRADPTPAPRPARGRLACAGGKRGTIWLQTAPRGDCSQRPRSPKQPRPDVRNFVSQGSARPPLPRDWPRRVRKIARARLFTGAKSSILNTWGDPKTPIYISFSTHFVGSIIPASSDNEPNYIPAISSYDNNLP